MRTIIFFSEPYAGKGTQVKMLLSRFKEKSIPCLLVETGKFFREGLPEDSFTKKKIAEAMNSGKLLPDFLAEAAVTSQLILNLCSGQLLILDGFPRTVKQAHKIREILDFYFCARSTEVIYLRVPRGITTERMEIRATEQGRKDDTLQAAEKRFLAFDKEKLGLIDFFVKNFNFIEIDGNRSLEEVHQEILKELGY